MEAGSPVRRARIIATVSAGEIHAGECRRSGAQKMPICNFRFDYADALPFVIITECLYAENIIKIARRRPVDRLENITAPEKLSAAPLRGQD